ncbi:MAG: FtsW/RodA/SpoVE family cell cycle protein [Proteobacteria bacterium]|nr:FtsW/RodA/SpoVE family cell cycle protein [Pseudomonadota bacterium]
MVFLDPWQQMHGGGFQIIQSYLGFQNGSLLGNGLRESKQKLFFLPEDHTDFIITVIDEKLGFMMSVCKLCPTQNGRSNFYNNRTAKSTTSP